jgi:hypothetical protein
MFGVASLFLIADLLSPGPLAKAHADLEGIKNCTKCHSAGEQVAQEKCLDCHKELQPQLAKGTGFHGHIPPAQRACNACHHEHQGRDFALIEWDKKKFDHARTGFALKGKHAPLDCAKCHEARFESAAAKALKRETYLGLPAACSACHFDEHRGQLGLDCAKCHGEQGWKPAPGFVHAKTAFPLRGAHQRVECLKCHAQILDAQTHAFPRPVHESFSRFKPVAHNRCSDCHQDVHQGRFGGDCERCHVEQSWTTLKQASGERAFHEKTRYPLRGAHATVACKDCHGSGKRAVYKNMKFAACMDCHKDAHDRQLAHPACERCHDVNGFRPARFEPKDHLATKYPLQGAHLAVGCAQCHPQRTPGVVVFHPDAQRCESCHADPHQKQFAQKSCATCHEVASFHKVNIDHSRYPLKASHATAACAGCHVNGRYIPVAQQCSACHADVHAGQLGADCAKCHDESKFKNTHFAHASWPLEGKHEKVTCAKCHPTAHVTVKYKGVPRDCEGCHADFHKGSFAGFKP